MLLHFSENDWFTSHFTSQAIHLYFPYLIYKRIVPETLKMCCVEADFNSNHVRREHLHQNIQTIKMNLMILCFHIVTIQCPTWTHMQEPHSGFVANGKHFIPPLIYLRYINSNCFQLRVYLFWKPFSWKSLFSSQTLPPCNKRILQFSLFQPILPLYVDSLILLDFIKNVVSLPYELKCKPG